MVVILNPGYVLSMTILSLPTIKLEETTVLTLYAHYVHIHVGVQLHVYMSVTV